MMEEYLFGEFLTPEPQVIKPWSEEKGLTNFLGENNCFINVVIQSLWHLEPFRLKFTQEKERHRHSQPCVYCALEVIFTQYEFSDESRLPPTALRETMALIFRPKQRFQLYEIDDAAEAFDAVLHCLHAQLVDSPSANPTTCTDTNCVAHKVFGMNVIEQIICNKCGAVSEATQANLFTVYSYATLLRESYLNEPGLSFCEYLRRAGEEDLRSCPSKKCTNKCPISHYLTSLPEVFSVSVAWEREDPLLSDIQTVLKMITMSVNISNVFTFEPSKSNKKPSYYYRLRGMICYYGKHYVAFFYNYVRKQWFNFDDSTVRMVGTEWSDIQERCVRGRLQPSVLFYEAEQPVDSSQVFEKLVQSLHSHIKISTVIPKDINPSDLSLAMSKMPLTNTEDDPEESFIFLPSASRIDDAQRGDIDFVVTRTNWLYRRQVRTFRFSEDCFKRILPTSGEEKSIFDYKDVLDVTRVDNTNIIINFYSGKESQYIQSDQAQEIIDALVRKCKAKGHTFAVKGFAPMRG